MQFKGKIKVLDSKDNVLVDVQNTIAKLFEEMVATGGIDSIYSACNPKEMGESYISSKTPFIDSNGYRSMSIFKHEPLTVYFLNLDDAEIKALSNNSNVLPVYNSSFELDESKIVGYAYPISAATGSKQGYSEELSGITLINPRRHGQKFRWDANVMSGSYNCIAVGLNVMYSRFPGVALYRGLDCNNTVIGDSASTGYMIRPGVKNSDGSVVITSDTQILVGDGTSPSKGRRLIDLVTGEVTLLSSTDAAYDFPLLDAKYTQQVVGDYLLYDSGNTINRMNIATKAQTSMGTGNGGFLYNGFYYVRADYDYTYFKKYNTSTWSSTTNDLDLTNMNVPDVLMSKISNPRFSITQLDDTHYLGTCYNTSYFGYPNSNYGEKICGVIFTDITNISGSIVKFLPNLDSCNGCLINGKYYFFSNNILVSNVNKNKYIYRNSSNTEVTVDKKGVKFTTEDLCGNMFSFHTFETPQQIPAGEAIKLEYYYTFEQ